MRSPTFATRCFAMLACGIAATVLTAGPASAHAPDEYGHNTYLSLAEDGVHIEMHLTPGPLVGAQLAELIDTNNDGGFSEAETTAYGARIAADLVTSVDGEDRPVALVSVVVPPPLDVKAGSAEIVWTGIAAGPTVKREVRFADHHQVLRGGAQVSLLSDSELPADLVIDRSISRGIRITGSFTAKAVASTTAPATASAPLPSADSVNAANSVNATGAATTAMSSAKRLQNILGDANSIGAMAAALGIAALLGALHALTPGHGKTIAGAYLVGEQATVRHAIVLGGSVTITHTASVLVLGAVSIGLTGRIDPATLTSGLRWISGVLVLTIGLTLLVRRLRGREHGHSHGPGDHSHGPGGDSHGHDRPHEHDHSHGHDRPHEHDHSHGFHEYADHQPANHRHSFGNAAKPVGFRRLVALGASGGLIPCPEALGVLIVAVAVRRQVFGMAMIIAFSLGLASVLVAIGIALVRARRIVNRFTTIPDVVTQRVLPVFSAGVVSLLGVAILSGHVV